MNADASTTSLSSTVSQRGELRIGDRVIVSSSQGSKTGVLRYLGITEFAAGEWCGVELDDSIGKNDGSINGKRCAFPSSNLNSILMQQKKTRIFISFHRALCLIKYLRSFKAVIVKPSVAHEKIIASSHFFSSNRDQVNIKKICVHYFQGFFRFGKRMLISNFFISNSQYLISPIILRIFLSNSTVHHEPNDSRNASNDQDGI